MAGHYHHGHERENKQRHVPVGAEGDAAGHTAHGDDADGEGHHASAYEALFLNEQPLRDHGKRHRNKSVCEHCGPAVCTGEVFNDNACGYSYEFRNSGDSPQPRADGVGIALNERLFLIVPRHYRRCDAAYGRNQEPQPVPDAIVGGGEQRPDGDGDDGGEVAPQQHDVAVGNVALSGAFDHCSDDLKALSFGDFLFFHFWSC